MLTSTWGSRPKLSTPARFSPCRCCRIRRTAAASLSSALCTLAERSATTNKDCEAGVVCTWKPASAALKSSTIRVRSPSEIRARRRANGGGKNRQMAMMTSSATTPAPRRRGRVSSKPTVEGQPLGRHDGERRERDPWPDLELALMGRLHDGRPDWRQSEPIRRFQLRDGLGEQVHAEPGALQLSGDGLLHDVEAGWIRIAEGRDRARGERAPAVIRPGDGHRRRTGLGHDRDGFVRMEAMAWNAGRQQPLTQVLDEDGEGNPQRQVGLVQIEPDQHLPEWLIADEHERRLQAADERPAKCRTPEILAAGDVDILQVDVGEQRLAGVDGTDAPDADGLAAGQRRSRRRIDHDEGAIGQHGWRELIK